MPGIRLSTTNRSKVRSAEVTLRLADARRLDDLVALVAQRAAEPLEDLLLVVGEQDRAADGVMRAPPARQRQVDAGSRCLRRAGWSTTIVPPSPSMMFLAIGRPRPVPARRVVKYGIEDVRHVLGADADAAVLNGDGDASCVVRVLTMHRPARHGDLPAAPLARRRARLRGGAASTAWRALVRMLTSAVRSRSASVTQRRHRPDRGRARTGRCRRARPTPPPPTRGRRR